MHLHWTYLLSLVCLLETTLAVWPQPTDFTNGTQVLWINNDIVGVYKSPFPNNTPAMSYRYNISHLFSTPSSLTYRRSTVRRAVDSSSPLSEEKLLTDAFTRFKQDVVTTNFVPWKFHPRAANFEPDPYKAKQYIKKVTFQHVVSPSVTNQTGEEDEQYSLTISEKGDVSITYATAVGALHALTSLAQLFYKHSKGGVYTPFAPLSIHDKPAYSHRGLNLDISRNYMAPKDVKRMIDAMALNKFNRLHLHATDSQSWPIEIPAIPELASKGAYHAGLTWSVADLKSVQTYAAQRGIQSYLEIDSPGHTASIAYSFPNLITGFNQQPWSTFAAEPPSGQVKLASPDVKSFFDKLYSDLLPRVSPFSSLFHTGGDEINVNVYTLDPALHTNDSRLLQPHLQTFVQNLHNTIRSYGFTPMVWEETVIVWNVTLPNSTIVQTWQGQESLAAVLATGHKALFGDYNHWYLDCGFGQWVDPSPANKQTPIAPPYTDYCSPLKNWREIYSYDPTINITTSALGGIIGGEVHMWGETTDPVNLDSKAWPRAAAAAEIMWSGVKGVKGVNEAVTRRLAEMRERLVDVGVRAGPVQMTWCLQNPGDCAL